AHDALAPHPTFTPRRSPSGLTATHPAIPPLAPAVRIARAWSASNAPSSQNTSIQRAYGRLASSIGPVTRSTYDATSSAYSLGTTCAPRYVVSSVNCQAVASARQSSCAARRQPLLISPAVV